MAVLAGLGRRNVREARLFHGCVAVAAVDAHGSDVMSVTELDGLIDRHFLARDVAGPGNRHDDPPEEAQRHDRADNAGLGPEVTASMEDLTHRPGVVALSESYRLYRTE